MMTFWYLRSWLLLFIFLKICLCLEISTVIVFSDSDECFIFSGRQQSTFTVTGHGGRNDDIEIVGNGTLIIWRVVLADEGQ